MNRSTRPRSGSRVEARAEADEGADAARRAALDEQVNAATAAHVERLRGLGSGRLREALSEAAAASKAAADAYSRTHAAEDFARCLDAWALIRAGWELAYPASRVGA